MHNNSTDRKGVNFNLVLINNNLGTASSYGHHVRSLCMDTKYGPHTRIYI